ncbi:hypothetical protein ES708_06629 [subsurface metagenome]
MSLIEEGQEIARKLGGEVIYNGPWLPYGPKGEFLGHFFTDRVTGSSFPAKTLEEAKAILIQSRKDWGAKPPVFANDPAVQGGNMPKERAISPLWIIPVSIILGIGAGLGLILAVAREEAPKEIELSPGGNMVRWTGDPTYVSDALADIIDYIENFYVLRETDQVWIEISRDIWNTWAIGRNQICGIYVDRACTVKGFVWVG